MEKFYAGIGVPKIIPHLCEAMPPVVQCSPQKSGAGCADGQAARQKLTIPNGVAD